MAMETFPDKGWAWMVMAASFGTNVVNGCFSYCIGIIHNVLLDKYEESQVYTSWAGAILLLSMGSVGPISSIFIQRFDCRRTTMIGGLLITISCLISAFMPSLYLVIIFFGVIGGFGTGLTYTTSMVVNGFNFKEKRNFASGIAASGAPVGTFLFPPILSFCSETYGYTGFFIVLAGISVQKCLFGALFRPSLLEKESKNKIQSGKTDDASQHIQIYLHLLQTKGIILMTISSFFQGIGVYLVFLHLPHYVITKHTSPLEASFLVSIAGGLGFFSRILTGFIANFERVREIYLYTGSFILLGISTSLFPLYSSSYIGQVFYAVTLGMFFGNCYGIMNSINISLVGMEYLAPTYGMEMFAVGIGSFVGSIIGGVVVDSVGTYEPAFILGGGCICLAGVLPLLTLCVCERHGCKVMRKQKQQYEFNIEEPYTGITGKGIMDATFMTKLEIEK